MPTVRPYKVGKVPKPRHQPPHTHAIGLQDDKAEGILLTAILDELRQGHQKLDIIARRVAFVALVLLLGIGLAMCNVAMGMG